MNMQINQAMDQAWERRKLVAGALKTAHVYRKCADYEDLFQEGLIVYAQCLQEMADKPQEEADKLPSARSTGGSLTCSGRKSGKETTTNHCCCRLCWSGRPAQSAS